MLKSNCNKCKWGEDKNKCKAGYDRKFVEQFNATCAAFMPVKNQLKY